MNTTIDIPDSLYPVILAASTARGVSVEAFVVDAASVAADGPTTLAASNASPTFGEAEGVCTHLGWWEKIPKAPREEVREVQQIIDSEFSRVDPRDWE